MKIYVQERTIYCAEIEAEKEMKPEEICEMALKKVNSRLCARVGRPELVIVQQQNERE